MRPAWPLAVVVLVAGCAIGVVGAGSSAAGGCSEFTRAASPHRPGYTRAQVERAFAAEGFQLSWSFQSYAAPGRQAVRCHVMLADQLLYSGGPNGPCLYVYLFPEKLGNAPAGERPRRCGDASGRPPAGLRPGTRIAGSLLVEYTLGMSGIVRVEHALGRLR